MQRATTPSTYLIDEETFEWISSLTSAQAEFSSDCAQQLDEMGGLGNRIYNFFNCNTGINSTESPLDYSSLAIK